MSKTARAYCIRPLAVAMLLITCNIAFGQKPTVAVMVNDNTSNKSKKLSEDMKGSLRSSLEEAMLKKYALFDRTDDVLKMIMESHALDRSGLVDTNTIKRIGEQIGVDFLCVITTTWPIDAYKLEARLTNVRTRRVYPANENSLLNTNPEIDSVAARLARKLYEYADSKSVGGAGQAISGGSGGGGASPLAHEGKTYKTVKMPDGKTWMAENMNDAAGKSACYQNSEANCQRCGRLYDWATATMICPSGWHLPSDAEWTALENASGGSTAGTALKSKSGWSSDGNGMDKHGFSALPCGYRNADGSFSYYGSSANFWSATENGSGIAWYRFLNAGYANVGRIIDDKAYLFSVRCVRD